MPLWVELLLRGSLLFMVSGLYALALQFTEWGRWLASRRTWASVVIGDLLVVGALAGLLPWVHLAELLGALAVAGGPIIYRSWHNERADEASIREVARR